MRALDLYCKAGGAAKGLQHAGFYVCGIDLLPQRHYCGDHFIQHNALTIALRFIRKFDFVWASPPCQRYSAGAARWGTSLDHPDLIAATRSLLIASGVPYVIENIAPARPHLIDPIMLCGQMFGLGVFRHRLFESSFPLTAPVHADHDGKIGDGRYFTVTGHAGGSSTRDGWKGGSTEDWKRAMEIDWMNGAELAEAIPPAYSKYIAGRFLTGK